MGIYAGKLAENSYTNQGQISRIKRFLADCSVTGQLLSLAIVIVIFAIGTGGTFLSLTNIQTIIGLAGIPMILCLGLHQIIILGAIDLSLEGIIAISAVIAGFLIKNPNTAYDLGLLVIPVTLIIGAAAGLLNGILNTKLKMPSFIATLGISWVMFGLAVFLSGGISTPLLDHRFQNFINGTTFGIPNVTYVAFVLFIVLHIIQKRTKLGKYTYAIGGDEILAAQAGINVTKTKIINFTIAGAIYGLAGLLLVARLNSSAARLGNNLLFPAMTAVAVGGVSMSGGVGGALNAVFGTIIVTALNNGMVLMHVSPYTQSAVNGIVLISAVALTIDRKKIGIIK